MTTSFGPSAVLLGVEEHETVFVVDTGFGDSRRRDALVERAKDGDSCFRERRLSQHAYISTYKRDVDCLWFQPPAYLLSSLP